MKKLFLVLLAVIVVFPCTVFAVESKELYRFDVGEFFTNMSTTEKNNFRTSL